MKLYILFLSIVYLYPLQQLQLNQILIIITALHDHYSTHYTIIVPTMLLISLLYSSMIVGHKNISLNIQCRHQV